MPWWMLQSLPSFAEGAWGLPSDMVAQVHKGEVVGQVADLAAGISAGISRDRGASSAGPSVSVNPTANFHISAIDSASTAQWARDNASVLARTIQQASRQGALLGMRTRI